MGVSETQRRHRVQALPPEVPRDAAAACVQEPRLCQARGGGRKVDVPALCAVSETAGGHPPPQWGAGLPGPEAASLRAPLGPFHRRETEAGAPWALGPDPGLASRCPWACHTSGFVSEPERLCSRVQLPRFQAHL